MKSIITTSISLLLFISCSEPGSTNIRLNGTEKNLPDELKGLKVYDVFIDGTNSVKVAILNNQLNSLYYKKGKSDETVLLLNEGNDKLIKVKNILMENDSLIVCKK